LFLILDFSATQGPSNARLFQGLRSSSSTESVTDSPISPSYQIMFGIFRLVSVRSGWPLAREYRLGELTRREAWVYRFASRHPYACRGALELEAGDVFRTEFHTARKHFPHLGSSAISYVFLL
jgi:hypothetical protein